MRVEFARLRGQVTDDWAAAEAQFHRVQSLGPFADSPGAAALGALALHHVYVAIESLIERCTRMFEGGVPSGPGSHRELLEGAARDVPGVRPPLLSRDAVVMLRDFLAFRHFLHHAYTSDLDPRRLEALRAAIPALHTQLRADIAHLDARLAELAG